MTDPLTDSAQNDRCPLVTLSPFAPLRVNSAKGFGGSFAQYAGGASTPVAGRVHRAACDVCDSGRYAAENRRYESPLQVR
jgi:hypothetical protein